MAKYIPNEGESPAYVAHVPMQWAHATVGAATTNDIVVGDTTTYNLFTVTEPITVHQVFTQVETAFTASVALDIGDSDNLERFSGSATIGATSTGAVLVASTGLTVPYKYAAAQNITIDVNGATVAAGLLHVYMQYSLVRD